MPAVHVLNPPTMQQASSARRGDLARNPGREPVPTFLGPILLTPLVLFVHGYHPFAGDAGLYVAGVRHILDPSLYPLNAAFPAAFTRLSLFPWALAAVVRVAHQRLSWVLLAAHLGSVFLFLLACRALAARLFVRASATWCAMLLAAACFTLPVAGTALFVMDPYVTARSFSTPLSLLGIVACVDRAWLRTVLLLSAAALIHPLMAGYAVVFAILYALIASGRTRMAMILCFTMVALGGIVFALAHRAPISPAYREAVSLPARTFLFLARWHWYEVCGLVAPLLLLALALGWTGSGRPVRALCLTCLLLGVTSIFVAGLFVPPGGPYVLVPFQVLRSFHLVYAVGLVLCGGILAVVMARSRFVGITLLTALLAGLFAAEPVAWRGCNRIEWPDASPENPYQQAFLWIRDHTPRSAIFAFNPRLVYLHEEDEQGFRAMAGRDHLADDKDAGIVTVQPGLADRWAQQRNAELEVDRMTDAQRRALLAPLGATWVLLPPDAETDLSCPYWNAVVRVCRMSP